MLLGHLRSLCFRIIDFLSRTFNFITFDKFSYLSSRTNRTSSANRLQKKHNCSLDCLSSSSNSSDSESESPLNRGTSRRNNNLETTSKYSEIIASEAVAHSYEDITRPNYYNYLWLSSQWDRTDLFSSFYFLFNWVDHFKSSKLVSFNQEINDVTNHKKSIMQYIWEKERKCNTFLEFIHILVPLPDSFFSRRKISLPKKLKTLVLDLDETLIHSTTSSCSNFDFMVEVLVNRASCLYYVYKRPNLDYFLSVVSNWYNLVIYTASVREYADPVIDLIDENRRLFKRRLFRSDCAQTPSSHYLKDLSKIESDISKMCLIDNSAASFAFYPDNAIPIESWKDDPEDSALLDLLPFLDALRFVEDMRSVLSLRRFLLFHNK